MVVKVDSVPEETADMLLRFETVSMHMLFLDRANYALEQTVLRHTVECD